MPIKFTQEDLQTISSPLRSEDFFLFKIHGDIDRPESIVLGSKSYNQILLRTPEYLHFLETLFTTHTVLFIGFSGNDIDLDFVTDRLSTIYSRTLNKHYILLPNDKYNLTEKRRLLLDKRLEVIDYEKDNSHSQVDFFFNTLDELVNKTDNPEPTKFPRRKEKPDMFIISSKNFEKKHGKEVREIVGKFSLESTVWFWGLDAELSIDHLNSMLSRTDVVLMFFDKEVLKLKEVESLFELLTLREIDERVKMIPITIGDTESVPVFIRRRSIFLKEFNSNILNDILKTYLKDR